jgi:M6 family metalloprotease-like protein
MMRRILILGLAALAANAAPAKDSRAAVFRFRTGGVASTGEQSRSARASQNADSLKILALLAEFQADEDENTTGNGQFDLTRSPEYTIDRPPHNVSYFEQQTLALCNYYKTVSNGKLALSAFVFPQVLVLPLPMSGYASEEGVRTTDRGLAELFRDAVKAGDQAGAPFSAYDAFLIFHAGVGRDIELGYDFTPKDIPSAFLNLSDLESELDPADLENAGLPVQGGSFHVAEGIILPETENQEGYEIGLLGTMTLMFGFQLGLPALWNTDTNRSGIGRWGLMDQGSGNYYGLIPAEPCAFSKVLLGWEQPIEVTAGTGLSVACSHASDPRKIYRIPLNEHEYFLIENRLYDPNGDRITRGWDSQGRQVVFQPTGEIENPDSAGVIVRVEEYDYGLPGSGILVWHVDEKVLAEKRAENRVNSDRHHRAVDLEEADGAQDIGESYGYLSGGSGSESGVMHDAWYRGNEIHMLVNQSDSVAFTSDSRPDSRSYSGGRSSIRIASFSDPDTVMQFSVYNELVAVGFPVFFPDTLNPFAPVAADFNGDGGGETALAFSEGRMYVWDSNGRLLYPASASGAPVAQAAFSAEPLFFDPDSDGSLEMIAGMQNGMVGLWEAEDFRGDSWPDPVWIRDLDAGAVTALASGGNQILAGTSHRRVVVLNSEGDIIRQNDLPSPLIDDAAVTGFNLLRRDGSVFAASLSHGLWLFESGEEPVPFSGQGFDLSMLHAPSSGFLDADSVFTAAPSDEKGHFFRGNRQAAIVDRGSPGFAIGDIQGDGMAEIVGTSAGQVWAYHPNGALCDHFPMPAYERDLEMSAPVIADADGDGKMEILVQTSAGNIEAYRADGTAAPDFPLSTGSVHRPVPPLICDLDGDGMIEIAAVADHAGMLSVWNFTGVLTDETAPWPEARHDAGRSGFNPAPSSPSGGTGDFFPEQFAYNYPNPNQDSHTTIRYRLEAASRVRIRIFDLSGEPVASFDGPGEPHTDNEVVWRLDGVDSGVYFCQIHAESPSGGKTVTFKIAVVK